MDPFVSARMTLVESWAKNIVALEDEHLVERPFGKQHYCGMNDD